MRRHLLVFLLHWQWLVPSCQTLAINQEESKEMAATVWSPRSLGRVLQHCLSGAKKWQCLGTESERLLDAATLDNNTWHLSEYLSIEPQQSSNDSQNARTIKGLAGKFLHLAQGRALRMRLPRQITISNAIDEFGNELGLDQGTVAIIDDKIDKIMAGFGSFDVQATATDNKDKDKDKQKKKKKKKKKKDKGKKKKKKKKKKDKDKDKDKKKKKKDKDKDKDKKKKKMKKEGKDKKKKQKNKSKYCLHKTGRKKKDKDKHMAMMGGMIMLATFAQMFLGKVILIAGSAFIMAKIALLISLLGSLKKGTTGHSGSSDHVIVTNAGASSGHSHESGWHRSMPTHSYSPSQLEIPTEDASHGQDQAYYAYETEQLNRRHLAAAATNTQEAAAILPRRGFL